MGYYKLDKNNVALLYELADLQHPHLKGDNHTRQIIDKVYSGEKLCPTEAFDCGKYYQRMLDQLEDFDPKSELYGEYLHAILVLAWSIKN